MNLPSTKRDLLASFLETYIFPTINNPNVNKIVDSTGTKISGYNAKS